MKVFGFYRFLKISSVCYCYGLAAAGIPPAGARRRMERNRQKLVGRDKGSLTEQQTEGTVTTTVQIRRKHDTNRTTHRAALPHRCRVLPSHE